ncbi:MAG TPA: anti-sigma factor [Tepidisphaeraceae bacterium]|nr:anti-sigma factor [Tepidisphaeraceae bacterium]
MPMTCEQCRELLPAFLSGDLSPAEQEAVNIHLAGGCPGCAGAFVEEQATVALLGFSLDPIPPPPLAKARLMERVTAGGDLNVAARETAGASDARKPAERGRWLRALAVAALVALVIGAGYHLLERRRSQQRIVALQRVIEDRDTRLAQLQSLVTTGQLSLIALDGSKPQPNASGRVFWDKDSGRWHVFVFDMQPPPPGREYELWFITADQKKVPAGTFGVDARGRGELVVQVPADLGPLALAAVTDEPVGGSPQPTGAIQLVGEVK